MLIILLCHSRVFLLLLSAISSYSSAVGPSSRSSSSSRAAAALLSSCETFFHGLPKSGHRRTSSNPCRCSLRALAPQSDFTMRYIFQTVSMHGCLRELFPRTFSHGRKSLCLCRNSKRCPADPSKKTVSPRSMQSRRESCKTEMPKRTRGERVRPRLPHRRSA